MFRVKISNLYSQEGKDEQNLPLKKMFMFVLRIDFPKGSNYSVYRRTVVVSSRKQQWCTEATGSDTWHSIKVS